MIKVCPECGKQFETNRKNQKYCKGPHYTRCIICGKEFEYDGSPTGKPKTCSKECMKVFMSQRLSSDEVRSKTEATNLKKYGTKAPAQNDDVKKKTIQTNLDKYGVTHSSKLESTQEKKKKTVLEKYGVEYSMQSDIVKDKVKNTNLEKYGCENVSSNPDIREKIKDTLIDHYGVDNPMKSEEIRDKVKQTNMERYGVDNPTKCKYIQDKVKDTNNRNLGVDWPVQSEKVKEKIAETNKERYGTTHPSQNEDVKQKIRKTVVERYGGYTLENEEQYNEFVNTMIEKYGTPYPLQVDEFKDKVKSTNSERYGVEWACMKNNKDNYHIVSKVNRDFAMKLYSMGMRYQLEFPIENRSYDIKLNDSNILIELDPTITHNSYMSIFDESDGLDKNYHLSKSKLAWEHGYRCIHIFDWEDKDRLMSLFIPKENIYARKCVFSQIDEKTACQFEDENHIQGKCKGQKLSYGLYYHGELVEVMTFGRPRYNRKFDSEILRLCTKCGYEVIGGASRLFKNAIEDFHPESVISYCDSSKFDGNVYENIGMKLDHVTEPTKVWSKDDKYITNNFLLQRGYDQIFNTDFGKGTSNEELMLDNGWLPVYDCGQKVYAWHESL